MVDCIDIESMLLLFWRLNAGSPFSTLCWSRSVDFLLSNFSFRRILLFLSSLGLGINVFLWEHCPPQWLPYDIRMMLLGIIQVCVRMGEILKKISGREIKGDVKMFIRFMSGMPLWGDGIFGEKEVVVSFNEAFKLVFCYSKNSGSIPIIKSETLRMWSWKGCMMSVAKPDRRRPWGIGTVAIVKENSSVRLVYGRGNEEKML